MAAKEYYMAGLGKLGAGDLEGAIVEFEQAIADDALVLHGASGMGAGIGPAGKG